MRRIIVLALVATIAACGGGDGDEPGNAQTNQDAGMSDAGTQPDAATNNTDPGEFVGADELVFDDGTFSVEVSQRADGTRIYQASTTYEGLLEDSPTSRTITESPDRMRLRSGRLAFDALFALAVQEADENAVEQISDGAFNDGAGVPCSCYETGEKWNYVWTRDTAYAVDLGLDWIDPERARRSLEFKLSQPKAGGPVEIVQDTGTGGSWPVSTDRVSWLIGAGGLSAFLDDPEAFRSLMFEAAENTVETDRAAVYDARVGLYRGEQSFLDWREQTYPRWTATDPRHIAQSHALSTNLLHWNALELSGRSAEAEELKQAIVDTFWDEEAGLYRAMTATELDGSVPAKYDLLGNSLAVRMGFPHAERVVSSYPYGPNGASVIWPQQPRIPIYHNRGQWPFVTAYAALAAAQTNNPEVFQRNAEALIRGAALNLSNMENFEWLSGAPRLEDGEFTGPVVNSRRQLWSVAGYIGLIVRGMFDISRPPAGSEGVAALGVISPFVPVSLRDRYFPESTELRLENILIDGVAHSVTLQLPPDAAEGDYLGYVQAFEELPPPEDTIDFIYRLEAYESAETAELTEAGDPADFRNIFAPVEPSELALTKIVSGVALSWDEPEPGVTYDVYRGGERVASDLQTTSWQETVDTSTQSPCYSVVAKFPTGLESHPSEPVCWFGDNGSRVQIRDVYTMQPVEGGVWSSEHGREHIGSWGAPTHSIHGAPFRPRWSGRHAVQVIYGNGSNGYTTGITAAVKRLVVRNLTDDTTEQKWVVMPQRADWANWGPSTVVYFDLDATKLYDWQLLDGMNMSYFSHFETYTAGPGGGADPYNAVNVHAVEFLPVSGPPGPAPTRSPVPLNGVDDFGKYATESTQTPGVPLQEWSRFAIAWDDDHVYATQVSEAFRDDFTPWMMYFGDGDESTGSRQGMEYSGLVPELPFAADWAVSVRAASYDGTSLDGPWNGVFRWNGQAWVHEARLAPDRGWWLSADRHTMSARIPRATFRGAQTVQFVSHVVNAQPANEWKETVPAGHTPWESPGGASGSLDFSGGN
jgi:hypothetical protein